ELLDARLVGRDRRALDAHVVLLDRVGGVDRHLVVRRVAVLDRQVEVLEVHVEVRVDEAVLDELPDDARHLVAVELDDRVDDLDLAHAQIAPTVGDWCPREADGDRCGPWARSVAHEGVADRGPGYSTSRRQDTLRPNDHGPHRETTRRFSGGAPPIFTHLPGRGG